MEERLAQHHLALTRLDGLVGRVREGDLTRSTPCEGWALADLLAHQVGQQSGFAAAVRDGDAPGSAYSPVPWTPQVWRESVAEVGAAFAGADPERPVVLRELSTEPLPLRVVVGAQLLDTVVHTWDVARSLGVDDVPPDELVAVTAQIAAALPATASGGGGPFAEPVPGSGGTTWEQTLRRLGRDPGG